MKFESIGWPEELRLRRSLAPNADTAGFTLIEVLAALSIVAIALTSIGALMASTSRGAQAIESRFKRFEIARSTMTALPNRSQLELGHFSGNTSRHDWSVEVRPFVTGDGQSNQRARWLPHSVLVTVRSPTGASIQITTIRLRRSDGG
jgi:prepilin-type N-terminal cleavage/methylation domain-containing protein